MPLVEVSLFILSGIIRFINLSMCIMVLSIYVVIFLGFSASLYM